MKVITLLNEKGGVGKSTLATYLGVGMSLRGQRVLFIDADMQANSTKALGINKEPGMYNLLARQANWKDVLRQVPQDVLGGEGLMIVLPSNFETRFVAELDGLTLKFASAIREVAHLFDVCVIDTSPQASKLQEAVVTSSDYLLMPTDCEAFSVLEGLRESIQHTQNIRKQAAQIGLDVAKVIGIIPNKVRMRTVLHQKFLESLQQDYGDLVFDEIPQTTAIGESQFMQEYLLTAAPDLSITKVLWAYVDRVLESIGVEDAL